MILDTWWVIKNDFERTKLGHACTGSCDLTQAGGLLRNERTLGSESEALALDPALRLEDLTFLHLK